MEVMDTCSVYGLAGTGLVLTYKTSGIFNFAHGTIAALMAYAFYDLRERHDLPWPLAHIGGGQELLKSPMNEDPLKLITEDWRLKVFDDLELHKRLGYPIQVRGDLNRVRVAVDYNTSRRKTHRRALNVEVLVDRLLCNLVRKADRHMTVS